MLIGMWASYNLADMTTVRMFVSWFKGEPGLTCVDLPEGEWENYEKCNPALRPDYRPPPVGGEESGDV